MGVRGRGRKCATSRARSHMALRNASAKLGSPMHCTLLIPDLLPPSELGADPYAELRLPCLGMLLARGETVRRAPLAGEDWLCERFGVPRQHDRPLAALMLKADGGEPRHYYWLCAEPIQLRVDRSRLIVAARVSDYTAADAGELIAALNRHFGADGIEFSAPTPARWYVRTQRAPVLTSTPLMEALNRSVKHHLPQGADALTWHRVMNEAQMILHEHHVNTAREALGATTANSIWLWGGGTLPEISRPSYTAAWGGGQVTRALAVAAGIAHHELPANGAAWLAAASAGDHLVVMDGPAQALRDGDVAAWQDRLIEIDSQWMQPLLNALREKAVARITIIACNRENLLETTVTRANLRKFWRRVRPLASYADNA